MNKSASLFGEEPLSQNLAEYTLFCTLSAPQVEMSLLHDIAQITLGAWPAASDSKLVTILIEMITSIGGTLPISLDSLSFKFHECTEPRADRDQP